MRVNPFWNWLMNVLNVGPVDAAARTIVAVALLTAAAAFNDRPLLAVGSGFVAVVLLGTALFRVCPLYTLFGIRRRPSPQPR